MGKSVRTLQRRSSNIFYRSGFSKQQISRDDGEFFPKLSITHKKGISARGSAVKISASTPNGAASASIVSASTDGKGIKIQSSTIDCGYYFGIAGDHSDEMMDLTVNPRLTVALDSSARSATAGGMDISGIELLVISARSQYLSPQLKISSAPATEASSPSRTSAAGTIEEERSNEKRALSDGRLVTRIDLSQPPDFVTEPTRLGERESNECGSMRQGEEEKEKKQEEEKEEEKEEERRGEEKTEEKTAAAAIGEILRRLSFSKLKIVIGTGCFIC